MMFKKVLIAEDHESCNISVRRTLKELGVLEADYVFYCDDAIKRIEKAIIIQDPYDLLITDLSFEEEHQKQSIALGSHLIKACRMVQPDLKVLVFSAESRPSLIQSLFADLQINGYVRKTRNDARDLQDAIKRIYKGFKYLAVDLKQASKDTHTHEFSTYDITIISLLSKGTLQKDIPAYLQINNIKPSGLSSVEKRFNLIREVCGFSNNEQLIVYCKDMGMI